VLCVFSVVLDYQPSSEQFSRPYCYLLRCRLVSRMQHSVQLVQFDMLLNPRFSGLYKHVGRGEFLKTETVLWRWRANAGVPGRLAVFKSRLVLILGRVHFCWTRTCLSVTWI